MRYETVLFDLDGTVIDTIGLIMASHRHATSEVLGRSLPDARLRAGIGRPLRAQMLELDPERADDLYHAYRAYNHHHHDAYVRPYDGLLGVLADLRAGGARVGVVTSKSIETVRMAFRLMPLQELLDVVVTADMTSRHKPDPEPLLVALSTLGAPAATASYVGDAPADIRAAHAASVAAIAVTWGAFDEATLRAEGPTAIAATPSELLAILTGDG